jgi:membrane protein
MKFMLKLWSLREGSLLDLARRTCRKSWDDEVFGQSARLAFYLFFALFPILLLLLIVLSKATDAGLGWRGALLDSLRRVLPADASALVAHTIGELNTRAVAGGGAILTALGAVWAALNGTWAIMMGLNKAYGVEEERSWWRVMSIAFCLSVCLSLVGLAGLAGILYGGRIIGDYPGAHFVLLRHIALWTPIVGLLFCSFAMLYRFGPNLKDRRWKWSIPGAVVAVALWVGFALLLRVYQEHASSSQRLYGGLNAVATLLLWLYLTGAAIFIGGEANSEIGRAATEAAKSAKLVTGTKRTG